MMARVLEPEVMDTEVDASEYDAMDFSEANARFADDAIALLASHDAPRLVDLGTGNGLIPLLLLERCPRAHVVAVDLAESMLAIARRRASERGLDDRITFVRADVKSTGLEAGSFDLVVSNSTAHHLPEPLALFEEIARLARPSGGFVVRDLFRPESPEVAWATVDRVAPNDSARQRQLFFDSLCAALTLDEVRERVGRAGLDGARVALVSDRHWTAERSSA
jgi:ubiquinone/menaquinone biosynthesis C-methylase UbiE